MNLRQEPACNPHKSEVLCQWWLPNQLFSAEKKICAVNPSPVLKRAAFDLRPGGKGWLLLPLIPAATYQNAPVQTSDGRDELKNSRAELGDSVRIYLYEAPPTPPSPPSPPSIDSLILLFSFYCSPVHIIEFGPFSSQIVTVGRHDLAICRLAYLATWQWDKFPGAFLLPNQSYLLPTTN